MSAKKVCAKRLRQMKKSRAKWNFFAHLAHLALGSGSPAIKLCLISVRTKLVNHLLHENRKSIPKIFNGKKHLTNVTLQILNFTMVS